MPTKAVSEKAVTQLWQLVCKCGGRKFNFVQTDVLSKLHKPHGRRLRCMVVCLKCGAESTVNRGPAKGVEHPWRWISPASLTTDKRKYK
jgi:hypothetical protein